MSNPGRLLVIGIDGMIGGAISALAHDRGYEVFGTTRRGHYSRNSVYLNLRHLSGIEDVILSAQRSRITRVVQCAGITSFRSCAEDPRGTRIVNVSNTLELINGLTEAGIQVVVLSSSAVFAGMGNASRTEEDLAIPLTEYGRQKIELESGLQSNANAKILRLTKVLNAKSLLHSWVDSLRQGLPVRAFNNIRLAPLAPARVAQEVLNTMFTLGPQIRHLSPPNDIIYFDAACLIAHKIGANKGLVESIEATMDLDEGLFPNEPAKLATIYHQTNSIVSSDKAIESYVLSENSLPA